MSNLDVLIKIQGDKMWMQYNGEWYPLNTNLTTGYGFSLKAVITLKLIELENS